jgi:hypothetical protein
MEVILIGDIHGRTIWKQIVERHPDADHYIFFGDYFDPYEDIPYWELAKNFKAIVQLKKELGDRVVLLLGNHDLHYYADVEPCSRYDYLNSSRIANLFKESLHLFQVAFEFEEVLCTHAGVSPHWYLKHFRNFTAPTEMVEKMNELHRDSPNLFEYYKSDKTGIGDHVFQSPLWIRPASLSQSLEVISNQTLNLQCVGHTPTDFLVNSVMNIHFVDLLFMNMYVQVFSGYFLTTSIYTEN